VYRGAPENLVHRVAGTMHGEANEREIVASHSPYRGTVGLVVPVTNSSSVNTAAGIPRRTARSWAAASTSASPASTSTG
jgi:hypothetical protein